jgi:diguanylate cyclase (GGDEF)-like protein
MEAPELGAGTYLLATRERLSLARLEAPGEVPFATPAELDDADPRRVSIAHLSDGWLWLATPRAILRLAPGTRLPRRAPFGLARRTRVPGDGAPILLPARPNHLDLRLSLEDPLAPRLVRYRWRIGDAPFGEWTADPVARLSNVPGGNVTFEAEARDRFGRPAPGAVRVPIRVAPLLSESVAFRAGALLLAVVAGAALARTRAGHAARRARELSETVKARDAELAEVKAALEEASLTDPLTGLKNRRFVSAVVYTALSSVLRQYRGKESEQGPHESLVFCLLDLDHFKRVNDRFGQAAGDDVLGTVAKALRDTVRGGTILARWGGEEFLVVERVRGTDIAEVFVERLRSVSAKADASSGAPHGLTVSAGYASYPFSAAYSELIGWQEVVSLADFALRAAKDAGRDAAFGACVDEPVLAAAVSDLGPVAVAKMLRNDPAAAERSGWVVLKRAAAVTAPPSFSGEFPRPSPPADSA